MIKQSLVNYSSSDDGELQIDTDDDRPLNKKRRKSKLDTTSEDTELPSAVPRDQGKFHTLPCTF